MNDDSSGHARDLVPGRWPLPQASSQDPEPSKHLVRVLSYAVGKDSGCQEAPDEQVHSQRENEGRRLEGEHAPEQRPASHRLQIPRKPVHTSFPLFCSVPWACLDWAERRVATHPPRAAAGALQGAPSTAWERSHSLGKLAGE